MAAIDYVFVIPAAVIIAVELYGLTVIRPKIKVAGRVPGTAASRVLFIFLAVMAVLRPQDVLKLPAVYGCALAAFGLHSFIRSGPGDEAFYNSSFTIPYDKVDYWQDIRDFSGGFTARFHCLNGREYVILYKEEQRKALDDIMTRHRIRDYDTVRFFDDDQEVEK